MSSELISETEFCALDIETTGTNPYTDRMVEIGMIRFTIDSTIREYQTLINPGVPIPYMVQRIHGISDQMVVDSPSASEIIRDIDSFIGRRPVVIHNVRFDLSFIEAEYRRNGMESPIFRSFDTVNFSRKVFPDMENHKLDTVSRTLGIDLSSHHRALADAAACMDIFRSCVKTADPLRCWTVDACAKFVPGGNRKPRETLEKSRKGGKIIVGKEVVIRYIDSSGVATERKILPKKIVTQGKQTVIYAYCYLRGEDRNFKAGRIEEVIG
jgi:DNA polymerase III epsilon subunit family exonuclease